VRAAAYKEIPGEFNPQPSELGRDDWVWFK
jgi:hypothetical protein